MNAEKPTHNSYVEFFHHLMEEEFFIFGKNRPRNKTPD